MPNLEMIKPKRLSPGDLIGIMSPSSPIDSELENQLIRGVSTLENLGFAVRFAKNYRKKYFHRAGAREERL